MHVRSNYIGIANNVGNGHVKWLTAVETDWQNVTNLEH